MKTSDFYFSSSKGRFEAIDGMHEKHAKNALKAILAKLDNGESIHRVKPDHKQMEDALENRLLKETAQEATKYILQDEDNSEFVNSLKARIADLEEENRNFQMYAEEVEKQVGQLARENNQLVDSLQNAHHGTLANAQATLLRDLMYTIDRRDLLAVLEGKYQEAENLKEEMRKRED